MPFFDSNRLNWPKNGDINAWADFVETICMFSEGNSLSLEDFIDFIKDDPAITLEEVLSALNFNEKFLAVPAPELVPPVPLAFPITGDVNEIEEDDEDEEDEDDDFAGDDEENEEREQIRSRLLVLFNFLQARSIYFADHYPFQITFGTYLTVRPALTSLQQIYIILLLSSEMHLFTPGDRNRIGHLFEAFCRMPFSFLLPQGANKKFFGAGAGEIIAADYTGSLYGRLKKLASDLGIQTKPAIEDPDELAATGDAGLDWVGWMSFSDDCDHQPVYFAQCACGTNWIDKQHETSRSIWQNYLDLNQSIQCFHFMPRSFRRTSLEWFRRTQIEAELTLIDRFRLLSICSSIPVDQLNVILNMYAILLQEASAFLYEDVA